MGSKIPFKSCTGNPSLEMSALLPGLKMSALLSGLEMFAYYQVLKCLYITRPWNVCILPDLDISALLLGLKMSALLLGLEMSALLANGTEGNSRTFII